MNRYCTYFDHRYLPRFLVLLDSLRRHGETAPVTALCLDEAAAEALERLDLDLVHVLRLEELEAYEPRLRAARADRSVVEHYFTCSPILPLWVLDHQPSDLVTYVDADLFVLQPLDGLYDELGEASVGIIEHRYPPDRPEDLVWGTYNVGWLAFRADDAAREVLHRWRDQCLEWCHDEPGPEGRFADQGYLNDWPEAFPQVRVIANPGANLAPWNVRTHQLSDHGLLRADGAPVLFFHVQGLRRLGTTVFHLGLEQYGARGTEALRARVYQPYTQALVAAEQRAAGVMGASSAAPLRQLRRTSGLTGRLRLARSWWRRNLLRP